MDKGKQKTKNPPLGIKIISIYVVIIFILNLLTTSSLSSSPDIIILVFAALITISIATTLWKGYNKARIMVLIFSSLGILNNLINLFLLKKSLLYPLISIILLIPIIWYLGFNKEAKTFFSQNIKK